MYSLSDPQDIFRQYIVIRESRNMFIKDALENSYSEYYTIIHPKPGCISKVVFDTKNAFEIPLRFLSSFLFFWAFLAACYFKNWAFYLFIPKSNY